MMEKQIKFYKDAQEVQVYQDMNRPTSIFKKYLVDYEIYKSKEDLKKMREKLIRIKECKNWPDYVIKPKKIYRLYEKSFMAEFPFIEGTQLDQYLLKQDIDFLTLAKFMKQLEEKIMNLQNFVFPDIANTGNIMILPDQQELDLCFIDPDGIQFGEYGCSERNVFLGTCFGYDDDIRGIKKCYNKDGFANKQLDIRSLYALFYMIMNGKDYFYPIFFEKSIEEYRDLLNSLNIPSSSDLYKRSLGTLSNSKPNEVIGDALFQLIDDGYDLEINSKNRCGNQYRLSKKRKFY